MVAFRPLLPPGPEGLLVDREFPPPQALEPQVKLVAPLLVLAEQCPLVVAEVEQPVVEQVLVELRLELPDQEVPPPQEELAQAELRLVPEDSEVHLLAERQVQEDSLPPRSNRDSWVLRAYSLQLKLVLLARSTCSDHYWLAWSPARGHSPTKTTSSRCSKQKSTRTPTRSVTSPGWKESTSNLSEKSTIWSAIK